jgi:hypothetical protein
MEKLRKTFQQPDVLSQLSTCKLQGTEEMIENRRRVSSQQTFIQGMNLGDHEARPVDTTLACIR